MTPGYPQRTPVLVFNREGTIQKRYYIEFILSDLISGITLPLSKSTGSFSLLSACLLKSFSKKHLVSGNFLQF